MSFHLYPDEDLPDSELTEEEKRQRQEHERKADWMADNLSEPVQGVIEDFLRRGKSYPEFVKALMDKMEDNELHKEKLTSWILHMAQRVGYDLKKHPERFAEHLRLDMAEAGRMAFDRAIEVKSEKPLANYVKYAMRLTRTSEKPLFESLALDILARHPSVAARVKAAERVSNRYMIRENALYDKRTGGRASLSPSYEKRLIRNLRRDPEISFGAARGKPEQLRAKIRRAIGG